jgi:hypothetical protein
MDWKGMDWIDGAVINPVIESLGSIKLRIFFAWVTNLFPRRTFLHGVS